MFARVLKVASVSAAAWHRRQYDPKPASGGKCSASARRGGLPCAPPVQYQPSADASARLIITAGGVNISFTIMAPSWIVPSRPPSSHAITSGE